MKRVKKLVLVFTLLGATPTIVQPSYGSKTIAGIFETAFGILVIRRVISKKHPRAFGAVLATCLIAHGLYNVVSDS